MILVLDTEQTTWNSGSPFDTRNFTVCMGYLTDTGKSGVIFEGFQSLQELIDEADLLVFFNAKYDLHWLRNNGLKVDKRVWCAQVAEYLLNRMEISYPSLDNAAERYQLPKKLDVVKETYWKQGINTDKIPRNVLAEYCLHDVELTYQIYLRQKQRLKQHQVQLFNLQMLDTLVLTEMEKNGLLIDIKKAEEKKKELEAEILQIQSELNLEHSVPNFNWASNDHLSALLYGGTITEVRKVPDGYYKSGQKKGLVKFRNETVTHILPRRIKPLKNTESAKGGTWSVDENTLLLLNNGDKLIEGILKLKKLQKLVNTYFTGLPKKLEESHVGNSILHGNFNQCVTRTGRLSSSNPNLQNLADAAQELFVSRFE